MSKIPTLKLPSNGKNVTFRASTVQDCIDYCDLNDDLDESTATEYLNRLQVGDIQDSALWTAQDRRLALWWIFVCTSPDTSVTYTAPCAHCDKEHVYVFDLADLDDEAKSLAIKPYFDDKLTFDGQERKIRFKPYDGQAMMNMEQARLERDYHPKDSKEYQRAHAHLKTLEVVHSFEFKDADKSLSFDEQADEKLKAVYTMERTTEFAELVAASIAAHKKLEHGLNCTFKDGQIFAVSPPMPCEDEQAVKKTKASGGTVAHTRLLLPFQSKLFIPSI